jgi:MFS family permease
VSVVTPPAALASETAAPAAPLSDRRVLLPWYAIEFLNSYTGALFCAGCYDYADKQLHKSPSVCLWLSAAWGLSYMFISLAGGRLAERFGPRRIVGLTLAGAILASALGLLAIGFPFIWVLLAVMLPFNMSNSMVWPALESAITRTPARMPLSTRMSMYNLSWSGAGFVAFFTCGAIESVSWSLVFIIPALCCVASSAIFRFWAIPARMIRKDHVPEESVHEQDIDDPARRRKAETLLKMAWIGNALAYVAINVFIPIKMRLADESGISNLAVAGYITAIWAFARFAGFGLAWKWAGWHYKIRWLLGAQIALAASFCLSLLIHHPIMLAASQIVFGLSTALVYSGSLYYAMHVSSGEGGHAGIHEALIGLGIAIGPAVGALAGGNHLDVHALHAIAWGVTAVMAVGIVVMAIVALRWRGRVTEPPRHQDTKNLVVN